MPDVGQQALIGKLLASLATNKSDSWLKYPQSPSDEAARKAVQHWLQGRDLGRFDHNDIVLANGGGQNGINLVLQSVLKGGEPIIFVEDVTYAGFRYAARLARAQVIGVEVDQDGIIPEALEKLCKAHKAQVLCTSPNVHNPTTSSTSLDRRRAIAKVAQRYDIQILEDDCYNIGQGDISSYRAIAPECSWYVSSISKELTPALRFGYVVGLQGQMNGLRRAALHGFFGVSKPITDLMASLLISEDAANMAIAVKNEVDRRVELIVNILGGSNLRWRHGVSFVWLTLPIGWRASSFCRASEQALRDSHIS